jgi:hypothetical protein
MRVTRAVPSFFLLLIFVVPLLFAQNTPTTSDAQAIGTLQNALAALTSNLGVSDMTLTGAVEWIAGSDDETGTVTYKGMSGAYRLDLTFSKGTRSEIVVPVSGTPRPVAPGERIHPHSPWL